MKALKIFSLLVLLVALAWTFTGLYGWSVFAFDPDVGSEFYKTALRDVYKIDADAYFRRMLMTSQIAALVGLASIATAIGLFRARAWARMSWLLISALAAAYEINHLISTYQSIRTIYERIDSVVVLFGAASWIYLIRQKTKRLFLGEASERVQD